MFKLQKMLSNEGLKIDQCKEDTYEHGSLSHNSPIPEFP